MSPNKPKVVYVIHRIDSNTHRLIDIIPRFCISGSLNRYEAILGIDKETFILTLSKEKAVEFVSH